MYAKAMLIGRLGIEPELRTSSGGKTYTRISLAVNDHGKEEPTWFYVFLWEKLAEIASKYSKKGSLVFVEAHLQSSNFESQSGDSVKTLTLNGQKFIILKGFKGEEEREKSREDVAKELLDSPQNDFPF